MKRKRKKEEEGRIKISRGEIKIGTRKRTTMKGRE